jgi:hypothetical protein
MKRFFLSALAASVFCSPVFAQDRVKTWRSLDSMGCMMLRECTEYVSEVHSWRDLGGDYELWKDELESILTSLKTLGVGVYVADEKYFLRNTRGLYNVNGNNFFLNREYLYQPTKMIQVIRHEGWHVAQDCMAGSLDNTFTGLIFAEEKVPDWIRKGAERTYPAKMVPFEAEAMWSMYSATRTKEALAVCASSKKMWEVFEPTPLTKKWLQEKGHMD